MSYARVTFTDDATGEARERTMAVTWTCRDQHGIMREALRKLDYWKGVSNVRVVATLSIGQTGWQDVPEGEGHLG